MSTRIMCQRYCLHGRLIVPTVSACACGRVRLTLVGEFFPWPLVPQYVQASWFLGGVARGDGFFCFRYELLVIASVDCGRSLTRLLGCQDLLQCHVLVLVAAACSLAVCALPLSLAPNTRIGMLPLWLPSCSPLFSL